MPALQNLSAIVKMLAFPQAAPGCGDTRKQRSSVGNVGDQCNKLKPKCLEASGVVRDHPVVEEVLGGLKTRGIAKGFFSFVLEGGVWDGSGHWVFINHLLY